MPKPLHKPKPNRIPDTVGNVMSNVELDHIVKPKDSRKNLKSIF